MAQSPDSIGAVLQSIPNAGFRCAYWPVFWPVLESSFVVLPPSSIVLAVSRVFGGFRRSGRSVCSVYCGCETSIFGTTSGCVGGPNLVSSEFAGLRGQVGTWCVSKKKEWYVAAPYISRCRSVRFFTEHICGFRANAQEGDYEKDSLAFGRPFDGNRRIGCAGCSQGGNIAWIFLRQRSSRLTTNYQLQPQRWCCRLCL